MPLLEDLVQNLSQFKELDRRKPNLAKGYLKRVRDLAEKSLKDRMKDVPWNPPANSARNFNAELPKKDWERMIKRVLLEKLF